MNDTICAISTSLGVGAISIIRVSGANSIKEVNKIFKGSDLTKAKTHTIHYGHIVDKEENEVIDEVLVSVMRSPKTFTTEDTVEINCHGGIATTQRVLSTLLKNNIRLSEPGEFTKRAFLNGRIDLIQAESVMDLINTETEKSRQLAISSLQGNSSNMIRNLRKEIVSILSNIEVNIDYPEYQDIEIITITKIKDFVNALSLNLEKIVKEYQNTRIIKTGINTVILGRPNVGKSSILNRLLDEEKAIVTEIPGTTRDIIEGEITINGVKINIKDTAGIRNTEEKVEKIGVKKSYEAISNADLLLIVLNNNDVLTTEDFELLNIHNKEKIVVINKNDLPQQLKTSEINDKDVISINTKDNQSINRLKEKIMKKFNLDTIETKNYNYLTNERQISYVNKSIKILNIIKENIKNNTPIDLIEIDLKEIWNLLGEILGENYQEELLDNLFSKFCVGK